VVFDESTTIVIARKENLGVTIPLPVRFLSVAAQQKERAVEISWSVAEVRNHRYFEVERSTDGIHFEAIAREDHPITSGTASFTFLDKTIRTADVLYYRIKQYDKDGSYHYSETKQVRYKNEDGLLLLYPTPVTSLLHLDYNAVAVNAVRIKIVNAGGVVVREEIKKLAVGINSWQLDTKQLKSGSYYLVIENSGGKTSYPFVKL
jgi:hypothetical protein